MSNYIEPYSRSDKVGGFDIKNKGWMTTEKYSVFSEHYVNNNQTSYVYLLSFPFFDFAKGYIERITVKHAAGNYVICDNNLNVLARYSSGDWSYTTHYEQ
jgi:hypothetical protein